MEPKTVELPLAKLPVGAATTTEPIARCEVVVAGIREKGDSVKQGVIEPCGDLAA
jgi:hypothetical protein